MSIWIQDDDLQSGDEGRLRLRSLIFIRWISIFGQIMALIVVAGVLNFETPLVPAAAVVMLAGLVNLVSSVIHRGRKRLSDWSAAWHLAFDLLQLSALLALTGGLGNPFALLLLAPVVVSASALPARYTVALAGWAIALITFLALIFLPLPWSEGGLDLPWLYRLALWIALMLAVIFTAAYVSALSRQARSLQEAYAAAQLALAREQRLAALGGLAAAAAHRLGSPLATIAVATRELEKDLQEGALDQDSLAADLALLREESDRCREILKELQERPETDESEPVKRAPLAAVVEEAARPYLLDSIDLEVRVDAGAREDTPFAERRPELIHGLGMLLQNAMQFARHLVTVDISVKDEEVRLSLRDDGPGFEEALIDSLGEPYFSTGDKGRQSGGHMGLGLFIARTFLERWGAELAFGNRRVDDGQGRRSVAGAEVVVTWPRRSLDPDRP